MDMDGNKVTDLFRRGLHDGITIALGYLAVGFSLGIAARNAGVGAFQGFLASIFTYASAGEYAAFQLIAENAPYFEMVLVILITNCRYFLMSCVLSQRAERKTGIIKRAFMGAFITDEIFGACIAYDGEVPPLYDYGLAAAAIPSWALGTMFGIIMGNILPPVIVTALSVALYGMFIAIVVPEAKSDRIVALAAAISIAASFLFDIVPLFRSIGEGMKTIILTFVISALFALIFPRKEENRDA